MSGAKGIENDTDEMVFELMVNMFESPAWDCAVMTFIDEHCDVFENTEENKLEYTQIHKEFTEVVEALIVEELSKAGIGPESLVHACERARDLKDLNKTVFQQMVAMEDFLTFKKLMVRRNAELAYEAMQEMEEEPIVAPANDREARDDFRQAAKESGPMSTIEADRVIAQAEQAEAKSDEAAPEPGQEHVVDKELRQAMDDNLRQMEMLHQAEEIEQLELEEAIAESLAIEQSRVAQEIEQMEMDRAMAASISDAKDGQGGSAAQGSGDQAKAAAKEEAVVVAAAAEPVVFAAAPKSAVVVNRPYQSPEPERQAAKQSRDIYDQVVSSSRETAQAAAAAAAKEVDDEPRQSSSSSRGASEAYDGPPSQQRQHVERQRAQSPEASVQHSRLQEEKYETSASSNRTAQAAPTPQQAAAAQTSLANLPSLGALKPMPKMSSMSMAPLPSIGELQEQMREKRRAAEDAFKKNQELLREQNSQQREMHEAAGVTPDDLERRRRQLKKQRDRIIAKKKKQRKERAEKARAEEGEPTNDDDGPSSRRSSPEKAPASPNKVAPAHQAESKDGEDDHAEHRAMMSKALARRLKQDLVVDSQHDRLRTIESQTAELDEKLRTVLQLRMQNREKEQQLQDAIAQHQAQRFKNVQLSVARDKQRDDFL